MDKYLKLIKDNLALISLIPIILGGLWQIISLSALSISYLRFFSITQLLSDGLLIIIFLIIFGIAISLIKYILTIGNLNSMELSYSWIIFQLFNSILLFIWILFPAIKEAIEKYNSVKITFPILIFSLFGISMTILAILNIIYSLILLIVKIGNFNFNFNDIFSNYKIKNPTIIIAYIIIYLFLFVFLKAFPWFNSLYKFPYNSINVKNVNFNYEKSRNLTKKDSVEILYFNDKFIFVKSTNGIEVLNFDKFFEIPEPIKNINNLK